MFSKNAILFKKILQTRKNTVEYVASSSSLGGYYSQFYDRRHSKRRGRLELIIWHDLVDTSFHYCSFHLVMQAIISFFWEPPETLLQGIICSLQKKKACCEKFPWIFCCDLDTDKLRIWDCSCWHVTHHHSRFVSDCSHNIASKLMIAWILYST